jgi:hypothetical protein
MKPKIKKKKMGVTESCTTPNPALHTFTSHPKTFIGFFRLSLGGKRLVIMLKRKLGL